MFQGPGFAELCDGAFDGALRSADAGRELADGEAWLGAERAKEARALDELVTARYGRDGTGDGAMA